MASRQLCPFSWGKLIGQLFRGAVGMLLTFPEAGISIFPDSRFLVFLLYQLGVSAPREQTYSLLTKGRGREL
jgi:hypothetical protein